MEIKIGDTLIHQHAPNCYYKVIKKIDNFGYKCALYNNKNLLLVYVNFPNFVLKHMTKEKEK